MCSEEKITAIILAAGYSSRMGDFKPLMKLNGQTVLERAVDSLCKSGISDIKVVTGYKSDEIIPLLDKHGVRFIINENYKEGMFSSVIAGVKDITENYSGFFLLPGDMPLVKPLTIDIILDESKKSGKGIIYPCFLGERGHPPFISSKYIFEILSSDKSENLRTILKRHEEDSADIELTDQAVIMDIDTPEDFQKAVYYVKHLNTPTEQECNAIFLKYNSSDTVIKHGKAVSEISSILGSVLNQTEKFSLDLDIIKAGALLHDIARDKTDHAAAGGLILEKLGYPEIAEIIAGHMDLEFNPEISKIDEKTVVYLADKFVKENIFISLGERFSESYKKFSDKPEALKNIIKREKTAYRIKEEIEKATGITDIETVIKMAETGL